MNVRDICGVLDALAPRALAAKWDNVGLLVGDGKATVQKMLLCIDLTGEVLAEAIRTKAQMVMAYHPVIFKGISRVTAEDAPVVYAAARRGIAVYSPHTAMDAAEGGTNDVLAEMLGLLDCRPLEPAFAESRCKIVVFLPPDDLLGVAKAVFAAGAGIIGDYHECSFFGHGIGTFHGGDQSHPALGRAGRQEAVEEVRLEMVAPWGRSAAVCQAIRDAHSYEEPAIDVYRLTDMPGRIGMGRVGRLARPVKLSTLLGRIKKGLGLNRVRVAGDPDGRKDRLIGTVAVAAGSAGTMWSSAANAGASLYLTGEMRHHDALAATEAGLSVVCVGHSHSERIALERLTERLAEKAPGLKTVLAKSDRDPFEIV